MKIIAHRGFSELYPENSLLAFNKAIEAGVDGIETDVRISCDGMAFIFHDSSLKRITGKDESIESQYSDYIKHLDIGSWMDEKFHAQRLPTLETLLHHIHERTHLILEIKYHKDTYKLACEAVAHAIADKLSWVEVSSFSDEILFYIHELNPEIALHKLVDELEVLNKDDFDKFYSFATYFDIDVNLKDEKKTKELIQNKKVVFWTVGDEDISDAVEQGLYGAMSNHPQHLIEKFKTAKI